jgi:hypothetical protein
MAYSFRLTPLPEPWNLFLSDAEQGIVRKLAAEQLHEDLLWAAVVDMANPRLTYLQQLDECAVLIRRLCRAAVALRAVVLSQPPEVLDD